MGAVGRRESGSEDRIDPVTRSLFGLRRKCPPGKVFPAGGGTVAAVGRVSPVRKRRRVGEGERVRESNFLDKMPQEGLAIIESKSKVRYPQGSRVMYSGSPTIQSDDSFPSSSPMKTSDSTFDEFTLPNSLPPGDDVFILKKDFQEDTSRIISNPLFEFNDNFKYSNSEPSLRRE
ncbi:hypothetical protein Tco_0541389 [Tanacetum coccineum]